MLALLVLLIAVRNVPWRLDNFDQAKSAYISLEMLQGDAASRWWYPHLPGQFHLATKPPLAGWLSALLYQPCLGNWELAWRLPSLLAAFALTLALWRAGREEWPRLGGVLTLGAFGLNVLTPRLATLVRTDMLLTLWITLPGLLIWWKLHRGLARPSPAALAWTGRERLLIAASVFLGMMTKGPVVYAFLLPGLLLHAWLSRRRGWHATAPAWSGWAEWLLPFLPFAIWLAVGIWQVPGFYEHVVGREFLGRFTVGERALHTNQPVWFYFLQGLVRWGPWSLLLLGVFFLAPSPRRWWRALTGDPATLWLFCWAAGGFVLMSLVPSKRVDRIFPVAPPLCLLLTAALARLHREQQSTDLVVTNDTAPTRVAFWSRATLAVALIATCASTAYYVQQGVKKRAGRLASFGAHARKLVAQRGWRCEVISDLPQFDEAMLVYLRRLRFLSPTEALAARDAGQAQAFVLPERLLGDDATWRERLGDFEILWQSAGGNASSGSRPPAAAAKRKMNLDAAQQQYLLIHWPEAKRPAAANSSALER